MNNQYWILITTPYDNNATYTLRKMNPKSNSIDNGRKNGERSDETNDLT